MQKLHAVLNIQIVQWMMRDWLVLNAMQAKELGAKILTRTQCLSATTENGVWAVKLENSQGESVVQAKVLVNAAGPWVAEFLQQNLKQKSPYGIRLIQGSHIIVPKMYDGDKAFIMQNDDQRIVFAIPYLQQYTLIGTTDQEFQVIRIMLKLLKMKLIICSMFQMIILRFSLHKTILLRAIRVCVPLCDDESDNPSAVTRDYTLSLTQVEGAVPLLSVFGGKLTTYRKLAESAMNLIKAIL